MLFLPAAFRRRSLPQWTVGVLHAPPGPVDGHVAEEMLVGVSGGGEYSADPCLPGMAGLLF